MRLARLALGLAGAAPDVRYLAAFLFGVAPFDLLTFSVAGAALMVQAPAS
jgi:hypothetical protein